MSNLIGYFTAETGQLKQLVHIWGYASFEDRLRRRAELLLQTKLDRFFNADHAGASAARIQDPQPEQLLAETLTVAEGSPVALVGCAYMDIGL